MWLGWVPGEMAGFCDVGEELFRSVTGSVWTAWSSPSLAKLTTYWAEVSSESGKEISSKND
jgi:hypothetical protein